MRVVRPKPSAVEREILRPLWKVHILHHASCAPILGHWVMEELRKHGYNVSPGTIYPMMVRLCRLGWLEPVEHESARSRQKTTHYRLTGSGRVALAEVHTRLRELQREVFGNKSIE